MQILAVAWYAAQRAGEVLRAVHRKPVIRRQRLDYAAAALLALVAVFGQPDWQHVVLVAAVYVTIMQARSVGRQVLAGIYGDETRPSSRVYPARLMLASFAGLILAGGFLLSLPKATTPQLRQRIDPARHMLCCLFTSTSATCVTGLTIYDTGRDFTLFGQVVILLLIQTGGLGIMIFGAVFGLLLRRKMSLRESLMLQDMYSHQTLGRIVSMTRFICAATLTTEAVAAAALYDMWPAEITNPGTRWFYSIFHAVSAFCNAGFSLNSDNLIPHSAAWQTYAVIAPTIVIGGLGFPVLADIGRFLRSSAGAAWSRLTDRSARLLPRPRLRTHLGLHSRMVLTTTATLIIAPTIALFIFERPTGASGLGRRHSPPRPPALKAQGPIPAPAEGFSWLTAWRADTAVEHEAAAGPSAAAMPRAAASPSAAAQQPISTPHGAPAEQATTRPNTAGVLPAAIEPGAAAMPEDVARRQAMEHADAPAVMRSQPALQRFGAAFFQTVATRTAGFNTISLALGDISSASLFLMSILMFIGGSPASTAGGVKTTAIAVLACSTMATLRRRTQVEAFHRRIDESLVRLAGVVVLVMFTWASVVVLLLSYTEQAPLAAILFEATSALGTVGLSTGLTPHLTVAGQFVIMIAMFAGRLGPLTLLIAMAGRETGASYDYPTEAVTIG